MMEPLLNDCRILLRNFRRLTIKHSYKEASQCADALAKFGTSQSTDYVIFYNALFVVENLLVFDKSKLFMIYLFAVNIFALSYYHYMIFWMILPKLVAEM